MSLLDALARSGSISIDVINLADLGKPKEEWEIVADRLVHVMDHGRRATKILQSVDRDDQAIALEVWVKKQLSPVLDLIAGHSPEEYDTEEKRDEFINEFMEKANALIPVVASVIDEIKLRHRKAMAGVELGDLFPIPAPEEPTPDVSEKETTNATD